MNEISPPRPADLPIPVRRVAMISVHTCPLALLGGKKTGGMNVYVRDLSRELARRGIQVDIFTRSQDACQPRVKHDIGPGSRVIHIPAGPETPLPTVEVGHYLTEFTAGVVDFVEQEAITYDIIHSHYWLSGLVAESLREAWRDAATGRSMVPVVHMFHTLGHMKNRVASEFEEPAPAARIDGERRVLDCADHIIAATPAEFAQLNWLYGADMNKVWVIPPGVDLAHFSPRDRVQAKTRVGLDCDEAAVLFAGRIEPLKGIDTLLRAMALIQARYPEIIEHACVTIIGGDPSNDDPDAEMARLQELRTELGIGDIVAFLGAKDQDVLPDYYAAAEVVVMPSHYESFGLVALEAMAVGTAVIASGVGGLAFLVQDGINGFQVPSRDPEALAERIYELLTDGELRRRLGRNAQANARQYSWQLIADRLLRVYETATMAYRRPSASSLSLPSHKNL